MESKSHCDHINFVKFYYRGATLWNFVSDYFKDCCSFKQFYGKVQSDPTFRESRFISLPAYSWQWKRHPIFNVWLLILNDFELWKSILCYHSFTITLIIHFMSQINFYFDTLILSHCINYNYFFIHIATDLTTKGI